MACNNLEHNYNCNCDKDGKVILIEISDDIITGYNGLIAAIPDTDSLLAEFNGYIQQYGGLDKVCEIFPYIDLDLNRYGIFVPKNMNPFSKFSNMYHIMKARRRDEAKDYAAMEANRVTKNENGSVFGSGFSGLPMMPPEQPMMGAYVPANEYDQSMQMGYNQPMMQQSSIPGFVPANGYAQNMQQPQHINMGGYVSVNGQCQINSMDSYTSSAQNYTNTSREAEQFALAAAQVFVSREEENPADKEPTISFGSNKFVENEKETGYSFNCNKIGDMEPEGGLLNFNPEWHPNDPRNYAQTQPQQMVGGAFGMPFVPQTNYYQTPGFVNENRSDKETFFSVGKLAQDRMLQQPNLDTNIPYMNAQNKNWKPNHPILKNAEFPEGIDESHPEFERVRNQMKFECFGPEAEMARAYTPSIDPSILNRNIIDTGDPTMLAPEMDEAEVEHRLLDEQFGERRRMKISQVNQAESDFVAMMHQQQPPTTMPQNLGGNPYFANNPWLQNHQAQMARMSNMGMANSGGYYGAVPGMNMMPPAIGMMPNMGMIPGANAQYFQTDNEWMLPTEEEIKTGKVAIATVVRDGKISEDIVEPVRKREEEDIKVAIVRKHTDENGVEYDEFLYGDREAANENPNKDSLTYKEAATIAKRSELEEDTYVLAKELARYNTLLSDSLIWYQKNVGMDEFMEIRREAQKQLIRYRNEDKLSNIKSTVFIAGDKTVVRPPKPTNMEELEKIARKELSGHQTQKDKEDSIVDRYRNVNSALNTQKRAILNGTSVTEIITKLQALTDMRINCGDAEIEMNERIDQRIKCLPPIKIEERENYLIWKRLMKSAKAYTGRDISNFDEQFDEWWNKPRIVTPAQKKEQFEKYRTRMTELSIEHLNRIVSNSPTPEQREKTYIDAVLKSWRDYDKGYITQDMGLYEHFDKLGFLLTRNIEVQIERDSNKASKLYDPSSYLAEVRKHSAIRNMQEGKGYIPTMDLMDQKVYNRKRQDFINQIFKKANRGTIT